MLQFKTGDWMKKKRNSLFFTLSFLSTYTLLKQPHASCISVLETANKVVYWSSLQGSTRKKMELWNHWSYDRWSANDPSVKVFFMMWYDGDNSKGWILKFQQSSFCQNNSQTKWDQKQFYGSLKFQSVTCVSLYSRVRNRLHFFPCWDKTHCVLL